MVALRRALLVGALLGFMHLNVAAAQDGGDGGDDDSGCLSPEAKAKLEKDVKAISFTLKTASKALELAAKVKGEPTATKLRKIAHVIDAVNDDLVSNITAIAEESCGTCSDITRAVSDAVATIENTADDIWPGWRDTKWGAIVSKGIDVILKIAQKVCPSAEAPNALVGDGCMSPEQKQKLQRRMGKIGKVLSAVSKTLKIAALTQKEPRSTQLENIANIVDIVNQDLIANITSIVDSVCGTCPQVTDAVENAVETIRNTADQIWPNWRDSKFGKIINKAIDKVIAIAHVICPSNELAEQPKLTFVAELARSDS